MEERPQITGLSQDQVLESRLKNGANVLTPPPKEPLWKPLLKKFGDPLIVILMVAGALSVGISLYEFFGLGDAWAVFFEPIGIFVAILLATGLAFYFEMNANKAFAILNQVNDEEPVRVVRDGNPMEIPKKDVVVGDVVFLGAGDEVPADGVLIEAVTLRVDESSLTGEPACVKTADTASLDPDATYPSNHVLRGTKVMEGHCIFKVTKVGDATENGKVYKQAQIDDSVKTPLNEQLDRLGMLITKASYCVAAAIIVGRLAHYFEWEPLAWTLAAPVAIFFYLVIRKFDGWSGKARVAAIIIFFVVFIAWVIGVAYLLPGRQLEPAKLLSHTLNTLMIAVTLIVVAVPEGLPMAVTLSLAYSMRSMLRTNNLVRRMHACETMGAATVICTDKTGTLTQNKMLVADFCLPGIDSDENLRHIVAEGIAVNSTASLDMSEDSPTPIGNPTEGALLLWLRGMGEDYLKLKAAAPMIAEIPFSTERKLMATTARSAALGRDTLYVKGAPEIVYSMCATAQGGLTREQLDALLNSYQQRAMRTLGLAYQTLDNGDRGIADGQIAATGLVFLGVVAISDPVRDDVPAAVKECLDAGISVKIVTGDMPETAREIARQIGLWTGDDTDRSIITGPELAALTDEELKLRADELKIIARARPSDKRRLVEALQAAGHVVAVTGDGTNDAPALRAAHVGLSMGDGTSVAKEASDITIIDNSFSSIGRAVRWGRSLFRNIQRFLLFQLTVNVSACLLVLMGAFIGTESPLTVTQMLWVNLIMDTFGAMALASLPPSDDVMRDKPRDRKAFILSRDLRKDVVAVGVVFFLITLALLYIFQHADITSMTDLLSLNFGQIISCQANEVTPYEQTLLFSVFVWTHFWYMFNARAFATGRSVLGLESSTGFKVIAAVIFAGQIIIVEVLYNFFNVVPMRLDDWVWIVLLTSLVVWVRELWLRIRPKREKTVKQTT